jgi:hypothetical protein
MAKFRVTLMDEERCLLRKMMSSGKGAARTLLHGRIWPGMSEAVTSGKVARTAPFSICSRQP